MRVGKGFKYKSPGEDFGSKSVYVDLSHEEIGLLDPTSPDEARDHFAELSKQVQGLLLIEQVKLGRLHPNQIAQELKPWLPNLALPISTLVQEATELTSLPTEPG